MFRVKRPVISRVRKMTKFFVTWHLPVEIETKIEENFATLSYDPGENLEPLSGLARSKVS